MLDLLGTLDVKPIWNELTAPAASIFSGSLIGAPPGDSFGLHPNKLDLEAMRLGCVTAALPYTFFSALRLCRNLLRPKVPAYIEATLCDSWLVEGTATDGLAITVPFRIAALRLLRSTRINAGDPAAKELESLRTKLSSFSARLSPLLKLEADLAWDYILLDEEQFDFQAERLLRNVLQAAVRGRRLGMLSWFSSARYRLPPECIRGDAAWFLSQHCNAHHIDAPELAAPKDPTASDLAALMPDDLSTIVVGFRRDATSIEFGPPSAERDVGLALVETNPMFITVREKGPQGEFLPATIHRFQRAETFRINCGSGQISLGDVTGRTYSLAAFRGNISDEAKKAAQALRFAESMKREKFSCEAHVIRVVDAGYVVKLAPPHNAIGSTAYLPSFPIKRLLVGDSLQVKVGAVDKRRRWVLVYPSYPDWFEESTRDHYTKRTDEPVVEDVIIPPDQTSSFLALAKADRHAVKEIPLDAFPKDVDIRPGDVFPAIVVRVAPRKIFRLVHRGETVLELGSAHVYVEPGSPLGDVAFDRQNRDFHQPGHFRFPSATRRIDGMWKPDVGTPVEIAVVGEVERRGKLGKLERFWEFELRPCTSKTDWIKRSLPPSEGTYRAARVNSLSTQGAILVAIHGKHKLWLPTKNMYPPLAYGELHSLQIGDTVYVNFVSNSAEAMERGCFLVRQLRPKNVSNHFKT